MSLRLPSRPFGLLATAFAFTSCQAVKTPSYEEMMNSAALTNQVEADCHGHGYDGLGSAQKQSLCADADHAQINLNGPNDVRLQLYQLRTLEGHVK